MAAIKPSSHPSDLPTLLHRSHAQVYRIALALCGNRPTAETVVEKVLRQSAAIFKRWKTDEEASRWFLHYTVLLSRNAKSPTGEDLLLSAATDSESAETIKALRKLPMQQREAFLLHHGEALDLRQLATAMDCSSAAAANHLVGAAKSLEQLCPLGIGDFTTQLPGLLRQLLPPSDALNVDLDRILAEQRRKEFIAMAIRWLWRLVPLTAIGWLLWWIWQHVEFVAS